MLMICLVRAYLDKQALEDLYDVLVRKYEKVKVTKFKKNANLGMFANFQQPEVVIIGNPGFMIDIMKEYGEVTTSTTPADENLFNVRDSPLLPAADAKRFHSFVFDGPIFKTPITFTKGEIVYKTYNAPKSADDTTKEYGFYFCDLLSQ